MSPLREPGDTHGEEGGEGFIPLFLQYGEQYQQESTPPVFTMLEVRTIALGTDDRVWCIRVCMSAWSAPGRRSMLVWQRKKRVPKPVPRHRNLWSVCAAYMPHVAEPDRSFDDEAPLTHSPPCMGPNTRTLSTYRLRSSPSAQASAASRPALLGLQGRGST